VGDDLNLLRDCAHLKLFIAVHHVLTPRGRPAQAQAADEKAHC